MAKINLSNLPACVEDSRLAWLDSDTGPEEPTVYSDLVSRLVASRAKLPPLYRVNAADPFIAAVKELGSDGFAHVLQKDPHREGQAGLLIDVAQSILQNGEGYEPRATDGFQEVISDLYDGFLSAEDRRGVKEPDYETIPPLVKWGNPTSGPYTWPVDATSSFGMDVGVVNLPPANARRGICAWAALGHETGGHDILHADEGLLRELSDKVAAAVAAAKLGNKLAEYWADRIDETASDVLGILNLGPAAAVGVLAYFRGINASLGWGPVLSSEGDADDVHPADIVRGWLGAEVVRLLKFKQAGAWADALVSETDKDAAKVVLAGHACHHGDREEVGGRRCADDRRRQAQHARRPRLRRNPELARQRRDAGGEAHRSADDGGGPPGTLRGRDLRGTRRRRGGDVRAEDAAGDPGDLRPHAGAPQGHARCESVVGAALRRAPWRRRARFRRRRAQGAQRGVDPCVRCDRRRRSLSSRFFARRNPP